MEITEWTIYWITRLDNIRTALGIVLGISVIPMFVMLGVFWTDDEMEKLHRIRKWILSWIIILLIVVFIPSTKDMIAIKVIPPVVNNEEVRKMPEEFLKFLNSYLEGKQEK